MKEIIITGATGFVGKNILKSLNDFYKIKIIQRSVLPNIHLNDLYNSHAIIHLAAIAEDNKVNIKFDDYFQVNTELTKSIFDKFLESDAKIFIFLSSVKAIADTCENLLTEESIPNPQTYYGKSKLFAERYISSKKLPIGKKVFILRPCIIHGPGNKGNLNLLYKFMSTGFPWPFSAYNNFRSYCSIDNLLFIIKELIDRNDIRSGIYNISDDDPLSTNEVIKIMSESSKIRMKLCRIPKTFILILAKFGNIFKLPFNEERLNKLTSSYVISNKKILDALGKKLPLSSKEGLIITFKYFQNNDKNI